MESGSSREELKDRVDMLERALKIVRKKLQWLIDNRYEFGESFTHDFGWISNRQKVLAMWQEARRSEGKRYKFVLDSMAEILAVLKEEE